MADPYGNKKPELFFRLLTAFFLLPVLGLVYFGGTAAIIFYLIAAAVMAFESVKVMGLKLVSVRGLLTLAAVVIPGLNLFAGEAVSPIASLVAGIAIMIALHRSWISVVLLSALMLMCFCFISLTLDQNQHWLVLMATVVIAADSMAFFGGRFFGGPKLAPMISPSKTWSGALCGLVGGGLVAGLVAPMLGISVQAGVIAGILIADFSIGGDLLESWFKRQHNVKDAGHILPGHGGILDRCDGYLLAAPLVFVVVALGGGNG